MNVEELRTRFLALPPIEPNTLSSHFWDEKRQGLRESAQTRDINEFLRWPEIGVTMFLGNFPFVAPEYDALLAERPEWLGLLAEDALGSPELWPGTITSANLIHMAYHLLQFENASGKKLAELKSIAEIGAGYGAMCKLAYRLGFQGDYYIYDLPEWALLQEFYLSQVEKRAKVKWVGKLPASPGLLVALWSLSETPYSIRKAVLTAPKPEHYMFGYQAFFEGIDNPAWFGNFAAEKLSYTWETKKINHHPGESWYLFGVKNGK
jgi:hypothetical protein